MDAHNSTIYDQQLNPLTPMAFLAPDAAYQSTIAAYVMVGSLGALIWDILINVDSDYKLLFKHKIGVPTITYFLSRASVLVYIIVNVIFQTAALPNCQVIKKTVCVLYHVAFSSTAFLFFLRVRAIFDKNKFVVAFFFVLWLGVLGGSLTVATVGNAVHLGPTKYCRATKLKPYASAAPITFAAHDTFVFLAISWRLLQNSMSDPHRSNLSLRSMVLGHSLPAFSRALLQDGQVYYLVSVTSNLVVAVITWARTVPLAYRLMFTIFNVAITNMMACRVYRHTRFGDFREDTISTQWLASRQVDVEAASSQGSPSQGTEVTEKAPPAVGVADSVHRVGKIQFAVSRGTVDDYA
ncbi:hypothetical protein D9615_008347 [Tricholomella constricta]|uniref:Uncharacterized protein n=1 Tax=Tricholomella constricta TaxID=117010 RepID=A0A8H5HDN2_9AGAR|nr:hypothetical protein D9615_008347 [Tricholomella constricta]